MFDYSKLLGLMKEKHKTQKDIAEISGMSNNTFSKKINGKAYFTTQEIFLISQTLNIPKCDIGIYFFNQ